MVLEVASGERRAEWIYGTRNSQLIVDIGDRPTQYIVLPKTIIPYIYIQRKGPGEDPGMSSFHPQHRPLKSMFFL